MRFLMDANVPRSAIALLLKFGHSAEHVRDIGLGASPDSEIALHAKPRMPSSSLATSIFQIYAPIRLRAILALSSCVCLTTQWLRKFSIFWRGS
jgi:hypothetical protein